MVHTNTEMIFSDIIKNNSPKAVAWIKGNEQNPQLTGIVKFFTTPYSGILIEAEICGLPNAGMASSSDFYAFHIHENGDCTPPFDKTGSHYNPSGAPHPYHAGDMIPLMGNQGYSWLSFYDSRIAIPDIIGRSVVIHQAADDFTTQPSGNAGEKIGCGVIKAI